MVVSKQVIPSTSIYRQLANDFCKKQPFYYDNAKLWWIWDSKRYKWKIVDIVDIINIFDNYFVMATENTKIKTQLIEALKKIGRKNEPKAAKKTWIQFKNKIVDFVTGTEWEAKPLWFVTNPIPWKLGESEDTPIMDKIFTQWAGVTRIITLYEVLAFCLLIDYPIHRIFCLIGAGLNGKGCFIRLLNKFIGEENTCSSELDLLTSSRFEKAKLYKKLMCSMGETNFGTFKRTATLKQLTGQDKIGFEFKNKNPFDDYNYAKIVIATNTLPMTSDKTIGFYRRWNIIDFPNTFDEKQDILASIPASEFENLARKCLKILPQLLKRGSFSFEGNLAERKARYEDKSNPLKKFIRECCIEDVNTKVPFFEFYDFFKGYLREKGYRELSKSETSKQLRDEDFEIKTGTGLRDDGKPTTWRYIYGLKLKHSGENEDETSD